MSSQLVSIIFILFLIYILVTPYYFNYLFNTILGRTILFLLIIYFISVNKILGIILSAILLYFYNMTYLEEISYRETSDKSLKLGQTPMSSIYQIYDSMNITKNKISLENILLKPKLSNQQVIFHPYSSRENEPSAYSEILKAVPY